MAFEVTFYYHEKKDNEYDKSNLLNFVKRLGKKMDDIADDKLASLILMQLARRDIWVVDVNIKELVRRDVSFKESKNGVLIRNKKYTLGDTGGVTFEEEENESPKSMPPPVKPQQFTQQSTQQPLRYEIFDPDKSYIPVLKQRGYDMTPGNKYPIWDEKTITNNVNIDGVSTEMNVYEYLVTDNQGNKIYLSSGHFYPEPKGMGNFQQPNGRLSYQSNSIVDMPTLRR